MIDIGNSAKSVLDIEQLLVDTKNTSNSNKKDKKKIGNLFEKLLSLSRHGNFTDLKTVQPRRWPLLVGKL